MFNYKNGVTEKPNLKYILGISKYIHNTTLNWKVAYDNKFHIK